MPDKRLKKIYKAVSESCRLNNATCTLDGTKTAYCDYGCGNSNTVTDEGFALGHAMGEFVVAKEATCTVNGEERADYYRCDY